MTKKLHTMSTEQLGRLFPIIISESQENWQELFGQEKERIITLLGPKIARRVEHVGSTAVPGLAAKPTIDILVEIPDGKEVEKSIIRTLKASGYEHMHDHPDHIMVVKGYTPEGFLGQAYHIHLGNLDRPKLHDMLRFRDLLQFNAALADDYADLKKRLAVRHQHDREAYTKAKTDFIESALEK